MHRGAVFVLLCCSCGRTPLAPVDAIDASCAGKGPNLVVDTASDEMDGPVDMRALDEAGATLSLREAIHLVNNGYEPKQIVFDPGVFTVGGGLIDLVSDPLPTLSRSGAVIDGCGANPVLRASEAAVPASTFAVTLTGAGAQICCMRIQSPHRALDVSLADGVRLDRVELVASAGGESLLRIADASDVTVVDSSLTGGAAVVSASPRLTIEGMRFLQAGNAAVGEEALGMDASPDAVLQDLEFLDSHWRALGLRSGSDSTIDGITGIGCDYTDCTADRMATISSADRVTVRNVMVEGWSDSAVVYESGANSTAVAPLIVGDDGMTLTGSATRDGATVDLYEVGPGFQRPVGSGEVVAGLWALAVTGGVSPTAYFRATSSSVDAGTSPESALYRSPRASLCEPEVSLFRNSFEPNEMNAWINTNIVSVTGFVDAPDGASYVRPSSSGDLILTVPVDLGSAATPVVRFYGFREGPSSSSMIYIDARQQGSPTWQQVGSVHATPGIFTVYTWSMQAFVGVTAVELRLRLDYAATRVDQIEVCDLG